MTDNPSSSRHVSYDQVKTIIDFMGQHVDFATGSLRSLEARHTSKTLWNELTRTLNNSRSGTKKTSDGWSKVCLILWWVHPNKFLPKQTLTLAVYFSPSNKIIVNTSQLLLYKRLFTANGQCQWSYHFPKSYRDRLTGIVSGLKIFPKT